jgi:hypothetical protein
MPKKYLFILKNINIESIDQKYGISIPSNLTNTDRPKNTTKIEDLLNNNSSNMISFLDESKRQVKCCVIMSDINSCQSPSEMSQECFWCRIPFREGIIPIGCPIQYIPHQAVKTYHSKISKDKYTIKQNITVGRAKQLTERKDKRISVLEGDYYQTDGAFDSFNCLASFISANKHNPLYNNSMTLTLEMYNRMHPDKPISNINLAPHWRMLRRCGGPLSDDEFFNSFNKILYIPHGHIKNTEAYTPKMKPIGWLYEEKMKF